MRSAREEGFGACLTIRTGRDAELRISFCTLQCARSAMGASSCKQRGVSRLALNHCRRINPILLCGPP